MSYQDIEMVLLSHEVPLAAASPSPLEVVIDLLKANPSTTRRP